MQFLWPVRIIQSEEKMMFRGVTIPLMIVRPSIVRHMIAAESVEVPPMEEVIVDTYVDRHENQEGEEDNRLLVEMYYQIRLVGDRGARRVHLPRIFRSPWLYSQGTPPSCTNILQRVRLKVRRGFSTRYS